MMDDGNCDGMFDRHIRIDERSDDHRPTSPLCCVDTYDAWCVLRDRVM